MNESGFPVAVLEDQIPVANRFHGIYPLEPRGLGTGSIEALSSYLCRLAAQHSLLTAVFLREVLVPAMPANNRVRHKILNYHLYTADGYGRMARRFVEALASLQQTRQAEWLTVLPWKAVFSKSGSGLHPASFRRWCPLCWQQDTQNGNPIYGRLAWSIGEVNICHHHRLILRETCPRCRKIQLAIPGVPFLDLCSHCGHDLKDSPTRPIKLSAHSRQDWMARAVDKLIERTCASQTALPKMAFKTKLLEYVKHYANGSSADFAKMLNLGADLVRNWIFKASNPGFVVAMEVLFRLDCPPDRFLLDSFEMLPQDIWRQQLQRPRYVTKDSYTENQTQKMERILNKVVRENRQPPPLITDIARRLKVRYAYLRYRFPGQYRIIAQRSTDYRMKLTRNKFSNRLDRLRRGYRKLTNRGIYPSQRALKAHGILLPSELRMASTRAELAKLHNATQLRVMNSRTRPKARRGFRQGVTSKD